jgi:hypothetical protein
MVEVRLAAVIHLRRISDPLVKDAVAIQPPS